MIRICVTEMDLVLFVQEMPTVLEVVFLKNVDHLFEIRHGIE